jgi:glycosyltransferase involved in cell wall biosynthesis
MRVLHVVPSFYPAIYYGGPIYTVRSLCRALGDLDCEIKVLTTDANGPTRLHVETSMPTFRNGYSIRYCRTRGGTFSPRLLALLRAHIVWAEVVHLTAVYSFPTLPTLALCKLLNKPVVWSPRGSLQTWPGQAKPRLKSAWNRASLLLTNKATTILHVTSTDEREASETRLPGLRAVVIPNGVDVPETHRRSPSSGELRLLAIGRLHAKKGLENLLDACKMLPTTPGWKLTIAGTGEASYVQNLQQRIDRLKLGGRVELTGLVDGDRREQVFADADLLMVPSFTENFGQVVAEALARGVPVITSKGTPWSEVEQKGCGAWIRNDPKAIAETIGRLRRMPLDRMGLAGREWMRAEFSWAARAREMYALYQESLA